MIKTITLSLTLLLLPLLVFADGFGYPGGITLGVTTPAGSNGAPANFALGVDANGHVTTNTATSGGGGNPTGSGAALTNVNASTLGSVSANGFFQNYSQTALFLYSAQLTLQANPLAINGQYIPPTDFSGNNWTILTNAIGSTKQPLFNATYNMLGRPSFYFGSSVLEVSNLCFAMKNGFTIVITYQDLLPTPISTQTFIFSLGGWGTSDNGSRALYLRDIDNGNTPPSGGEALGFTGGSEFWGNNPFGFPAGLYQLPLQTHVATFSWDGGQNVWTTCDGVPTFDQRIQNSADFSTLMNGTTNLYIGGDVSSEYGGGYFNGYISLVAIYTNACSPQWLQSMDNYYCQQAGLPVNCFNFGGDSIMQSLHTWTAMSAIQQILAHYFPNYLLRTEATSGRTSWQEYTNQLQWLPDKSSGNNFYLTDVGVNDFSPTVLGGLTGTTAALAQSNQVPKTAGFYTNMVLNAQTNNMPIAFQTLMSVYWETNSQLGLGGYDWRSNENVRIRGLTNLWPGNVYIVDVAALVPSMGTNGAYLNTNIVFNTDEVHPSSVGYTNMATVYLPIMQQMASTSQGASTINGPFNGNGAGLTNIPTSGILDFRAGETNLTSATSVIVIFSSPLSQTTKTNYTVTLEPFLSGITTPEITVKTTNGFTATFSSFTGDLDYTETPWH